MSSLWLVIRQMTAGQRLSYVRINRLLIRFTALIVMAIAVLTPVTVSGNSLFDKANVSDRITIAGKSVWAVGRNIMGNDGNNVPERIKGYTDNIVMVLGPDAIINEDITLVSYIAEQCGIEPSQPGLVLTLLYAPIPLWDGAKELPTVPVKDEEQIAIGAYAIALPTRPGESKTPAVEEVIDWINHSCDVIATQIVAEPNYLFRPQGNGSYVGGPHAVGNAPHETLQSFQSQWALRAVGVVDDGGNPILSSEGQNVLIGIFDTSPFPTGGIQTIPNGNFTLAVEHSFFSLNYGPLPTQSGCPPTHAEHGMYVASLAHTIAPQSAITLYQVMDDCLEGDVAHLLPALHHFFQRVQRSAGKRGIINMSFGARPLSANAPSAPGNWNGQSAPLALHAFLKFADQHGIVNVASAGNDSHDGNGNSLLPPLPASWPAAFDEIVVGVAATANEVDNGRTCYSNRMDLNQHGIAAPGGGITPNGKQPCAPAAILNLCTVQGQPASQPTRHCLIGMTSQGTYSYLTGTSFGAPIVAGIAALIEGDQLAAVGGIAQQCVPLGNVFGSVQSMPDPHLGKGLVRYRSPYLPC